jgi:peptide/nickel transport system substrate-binding protein
MGKLVRTLGIAVVLASAALGLLACGGDDDDGGAGGGKTGGSLTIAETSNPDFLDPALAYTFEAAVAHWLIYPGLVTYKHAEGAEGAQIIPAAAEALPEVSADGKTYTFRLRKGLRYSDGTPAKASDFEHAIQRSLTLEWGGLSFFEVIEGVTEYVKGGKEGADISGIDADDASGEIRVRLTEKNGQLNYILAFPSAGLVPGNTSFKNLSKAPPPGLGAYKFGKVEPNRQFVLERNTNFDLRGIPKGNADRITVKLIKSQSRQAQDVIDGKLDFMLDEPSADLLPEVREKYAGKQYEEDVTNSTYYMFLNVEERPFDKLEVRQAANYAFDKRAAVRIFGGLLDPDCNYLPPGMVGYEKIDPCPWGDPDAPPDVEKAKALVKEAGEEGTEVTVWADDEERSKRITEYYADVLNKIGLKAKPRIIGAETYFATIGNTKTKAQTGFDNWFQDFPHPADFFFLFEGGTIQPTNNQNHGLVDDPEVDKLAAEIKAGQADAVAEKSAALDRLMTGPEKAYLLPFGHAKETTFVSERMNFEDCTVYHPVYGNDWSQLCLK